MLSCCIFQIESETTAAADTSNKSLAILDELKSRLGDLRKRYTQNNFDVEKAEKAAQEAADLANQAEKVGISSHCSWVFCYSSLL